jgi:hypothetical protein
MKKLATILALTGVVANLGVASLAFAQTSGSQTIGCNAAGTTSISATNSVTFESRTTNFYAETDAPLNVGSDLTVDVTDTRGYDPAAGTDCEPPAAPDGVEDSSVLQIQSAGLVNGATTLSLELGTALTGADLSCTTTCAPSTLSDVAAAAGTADTGITSAQNLVTFDETFSGTIRTTMSTTDLEVVAPAGPVATGTYAGTITFSLV